MFNRVLGIFLVLTVLLIENSQSQTRASLGIEEAMNTTYVISLTPVYYVPSYIEDKRVCLSANVVSGVAKRGFFGKMKWCFSIPWISDCDDNSADIDDIKNTMTDMYNELTTEIDDVKAKTTAAFQDVSNKMSVIQKELQATVTDVNLLKTTMIGITTTQRAQQILNSYNQRLEQAKIQYLANIQSDMLSHIPQQFMLDDDKYNLYLAYSKINNSNHLVKDRKNTTIAYKKFISNTYTLPETPNLFPMCSDYDRIGVNAQSRYYYSDIISLAKFNQDCRGGMSSIIASRGDYCALNETISPFGIRFRATSTWTIPTSIPELCPSAFSNTICYIRHVTYSGMVHNIFTRNITFTPSNGFKVTDNQMPCPVRMYVTSDLYHISVIPEYLGLSSLISVTIGTDVTLPRQGVAVEEGFMTDYGNIVKCLRYKEVHNWVPVSKLTLNTTATIIPRELIQLVKKLVIFHYDDTYDLVIDEMSHLNGLDQPGDNCIHKELEGSVHMGDNWLICESILFSRYSSYSEWFDGSSRASGIASLMDRYNIKYDRYTNSLHITLKPYITYEWYSMDYYQSDCPILIDMEQFNNTCKYTFDDYMCNNGTCNKVITSYSSELALANKNGTYCMLVYCTTDGRVGYTDPISYNFTIYLPGITDISQYDDQLQQYLSNLTQQFIDIQVSMNSSILPNYTDFSQQRQEILDQIANMKTSDNNSLLIAWIALGFCIANTIVLIIFIVVVCCLNRNSSMMMLKHQLGF